MGPSLFWLLGVPAALGVESPGVIFWLRQAELAELAFSGLSRRLRFCRAGRMLSLPELLMLPPPPPPGEFSPALTVFPSPWPPLPALFAAAVVAAVTTGERTKREGEDMSSRIRTELRSSCFEAVVMQRATWPNVGVLKLAERTGTVLVRA